MNDYKLVPTELTAEMVEASGCEGNFKVSPHEQAQEMWEAMLVAAPAQQAEPVARVKTVGGYPDESEHVAEWLCKHKDLKDGDYLYLVQQPAEQKPDVSGLTEALRQYQHNDGTGLVFGYDKLLVDQYVAGLVEALEQGFPLLSDEGLDEVEHHCEWVIQRERKRVHSILAAYRKGGEA